MTTMTLFLPAVTSLAAANVSEADAPVAGSSDNTSPCAHMRQRDSKQPALRVATATTTSARISFRISW
jgi:hypothetical protein